MVAWSKLPPGVEDLPCRTLAHPWTNSCALAAADMFLASCVGSTGFFTLLYFCQYLSIAMKKKSKANWKEFAKLTARSSIFGVILASGSISISCLLRNILGKYNYYSALLLPASLASISCFWESKKGLQISSNAFVNCTLEFWIRMLQDNQTLKWTPKHQTGIFMAVSSFLSFLLGLSTYKQQLFWFYMARKIDNTPQDGCCWHTNTCWRHLLNLFITYSSTGFILQFVRLLGNNLKNPKVVLYALTTIKPFKLSAFLGSYVVIYEGIRCLLYQQNKKHSPVHDAIAGLIAGATYRLQPTLPIFNSGIIAIIQILAEFALDRKLIPNIPYMQIAFIISCGIGFHSKILHTKQCSEFMNYIMATITRGRSEYLAGNFFKVEEALKTTLGSKAL